LSTRTTKTNALGDLDGGERSRQGEPSLLGKNTQQPKEKREIEKGQLRLANLEPLAAGGSRSRSPPGSCLRKKAFAQEENHSFDRVAEGAAEKQPAEKNKEREGDQPEGKGDLLGGRPRP